MLPHRLKFASLARSAAAGLGHVASQRPWRAPLPSIPKIPWQSAFTSRLFFSDFKFLNVPRNGLVTDGHDFGGRFLKFRARREILRGMAPGPLSPPPSRVRSIKRELSRSPFTTLSEHKGAWNFIRNPSKKSDVSFTTRDSEKNFGPPDYRAKGKRCMHL